MKPLKPLIALAGPALLVTAVPAAAGCGLDVNPVRLDRDHNTRLSRAEVAGSALAGVFGQVDRDGNGAIDRPEFEARCASLSASDSHGWGDAWTDSVAGQKTERQTARQKNRVNNRVDRETDKAADSAVDKAMGAIFGN